MKFGLLVICEYENDAPEPEGTVLFDDLMPAIGTEKILCDDKIWVVVRLDKETCTVYMKRKGE